MRYIHKNAEAVLFSVAGHKVYKFFNHELTVGSNTTDNGGADVIDAALVPVAGADYKLIRPYAADLDGNQVTCIEMVGLGSLTGDTESGGTCTLLEGMRDFYEAPFKSGAGTVPATADIRFKVYVGDVTYNGSTYSAGQVFITDGSAITVTDADNDGVWSRWLPAEQDDSNCYEFLDEHFKIKHTQYGDEPFDYFEFNESVGYIPRDAQCDLDADAFGWTR